MYNYYIFEIILMSFVPVGIVGNICQETEDGSVQDIC
jgi:hypothetical protein